MYEKTGRDYSWKMKGGRLRSKNDRWWSILISLLSVASIRRKLQFIRLGSRTLPLKNEWSVRDLMDTIFFRNVYGRDECKKCRNKEKRTLFVVFLLNFQPPPPLKSLILQSQHSTFSFDLKPKKNQNYLLI